MQIEQLVIEALKPIEEHFKEFGPGREAAYSDHSDGYGTNLRLDFEVASYFEHDLVPLMIQQMVSDIVDVVENGDITLSSDPLLKAMNGAKKLNKKPVRIWFPRASYYAETAQGGKRYTVYVNLCVEWDDGTDSVRTTFAKEKVSV